MWTSTWFLVTAWTPDIHKASNSRADYRHQHDLQWQYRPRTLTQPSGETQTGNIITALGGSTSHGHQRMASGINTGRGYQHVPNGSMDHRHQHGFRQLHRLWTSTWPLVITGTINMASSSYTDHEHPPGLWLQHGPETSTWPSPATLQTIDINGPQLQQEPQTPSQPLVAVHLFSIICISNFA